MIAMKVTKETSPVLLMVDDDDEDIYLTKRAFCARQTNLQFQSVQNSSDLFDYLYNRGEFGDKEVFCIPDVILLDINIPKQNGFTILENLRKDSSYSHIPVVMLTTSSANHDIQKAYQLGANSFISKTVSLDGMTEVADKFCSYWFNFNRLPSN